MINREIPKWCNNCPLRNIHRQKNAKHELKFCFCIWEQYTALQNSP